MSDEDHPVSVAEFKQALQLLSLQPAPKKDGALDNIVKAICAIGVAAAIGGGGFVLKSTNDLNASMAVVLSKIQDMQDVKPAINAAALNDAKLDARVTNMEGRVGVLESKTAQQ